MKKTALAGLDIGTSKIRCVLYDVRGNILFNWSIKTPIIKKFDGLYNPVDEIFEIILKILKRTFNYSNKEKIIIKGISISSVGEAGVPIDKNNRALMDIIPWYDQRTEKIRNNFIKKNKDSKIYKFTGLSSDHFYSVYKILWIKKYKPNIYSKIYKWLPVNDYYAMRLSGKISTDYSQAMRTLLFNPEKLKWSKEMIKFFKIKHNILPKIINAGDKKGYFTNYIKKKLSLKYNSVIVAGGHDHFVGIYALGGFQENTAINSMGSAEAIAINTDKYFINKNLKKGKFISGVFKTKYKTSYYVVGSILTSGIIIEWFKDIFKIKKYNELKKLINNKQNKNILFFPQFEYSHSPINFIKTNGFITGLDRSTEISDIYMAMLKCLSFDTKNALDYICNETNIKINKIICSGGSVQNIDWMKIRANVFKFNLNIDTNIENVSLGSAILAGIGSNIYKDDKDAFKKIKNKFKVIKSNKKYHKNYINYGIKYNSSVEILSKLNNIL